MKISPQKPIAALWFATVCFAGIFLASAAQAQPTEQTVQNRFLFIFDTSSGMKPCVGNLQTYLNTMLASSLSGQLHAGDSIGVWTIGQTLRPGDYPLQTWDPGRAVMIASNLTRFVSKQHYSKTAHYEALQPLLNEVVAGSERLTVLIFCDGVTKITGTPYDDGINKLMLPKVDEQKRWHQPFAIMLRSQLGQYAGASVSFPPAVLNFMPFPPLPAPAPPVKPAPPANPPSAAPAVVVPPLIIVGTRVGTNKAPPLQPQPLNSAPVPAGIPTNAPANLPPAKPAATNASTTIEPSLPVVALAAQTNAPSAPPENAVAPTNPVPAITPVPVETPSSSGRLLLIVGVGLLVMVTALASFVWRRSRREDSSLITRSMNERK